MVGHHTATVSTSQTFIAGWYSITSMCSTTVAAKETRDAANPDSDAGVVGHDDLKGGNIPT